MSVYNIVRKCKLLDKNLKSKEMKNFYLKFFLYILELLWRFLLEELQCFVFANFFRYPRIGMVSHWRDSEM